MTINIALVKKLIASQFPKWSHLPLHSVEFGGWDNRVFLLGDKMLVRLPSQSCYENQVEKEQKYLPKLATILPLEIPKPLEMGMPEFGYPWKWSIYQWIEGKPLSSVSHADLENVAKTLAEFLKKLHQAPIENGPKPGINNFYRGGSLKHYDKETREAIDLLKDRIDVNLAKKIWEEALIEEWSKKPLWVHGDISAGNLLIQNGSLKAVIDFGLLSVGDPACDLVIAWTVFQKRSRDIFKTLLPYDLNTWSRARGWTLWKALIIEAKISESTSYEASHSSKILSELFHEAANELL